MTETTKLKPGQNRVKPADLKNRVADDIIGRVPHFETIADAARVALSKLTMSDLLDFQAAVRSVPTAPAAAPAAAPVPQTADAS